jgi:hypothetical protein
LRPRRIPPAASERPSDHVEADNLQVQEHHACCIGVVGVHDESSTFQMFDARARVTQPPYDRHSAVTTFRRDERLAAEIVIEVHFIPRLPQLLEALVGRLYPHGVRKLGAECRGPDGVVIQEEDPTWQSS